MSPEQQKLTAVQVLRQQAERYRRELNALERQLDGLQKSIKEKSAGLQATVEALQSIEGL